MKFHFYMLLERITKVPFNGTHKKSFIVPKLENLKSVTYFIFYVYIFFLITIPRRL